MADQTDSTVLPPYCRPAHVAKLFGITVPTVYRWIGQGILPTPKKMANGTTLWPRKQILAAFDKAPDVVVLSGK